MGCSPGDTVCSAEEKPVHQVSLAPFEILETEVTEAQYLAVTGKNPTCGASGTAGMPVRCATWFEAKAFCEMLGARLPTEAEWEYAARGGTTTKYYCGDLESCLNGIAWHGGNSGLNPHPVKGKTPNTYGLYDMIGNISEWTNDWYSSTYYTSSPGAAPQGPATGTHKVGRGGGYDFGQGSFRASMRLVASPASNDYIRGMRCARSQ